MRFAWSVLIVLIFWISESTNSTISKDDLSANGQHTDKLPRPRSKRMSVNALTLAIDIVSKAIDLVVEKLFHFEPDSDFHEKADRVGCKWFGTAPFCFNPKCPEDHNLVVRHSGGPIDSIRKPQPDPDSFGSFCFLGSKNYCCKGDRDVCELEYSTGYWISGVDGTKIHCRFGHRLENHRGPCGTFTCSFLHNRRLVRNFHKMWSLIWAVLLVFPLYAHVSLGSTVERETSIKPHHRSHNLTHRRTHRRGKNRRASGAAVLGGAVMAGASALASQLGADDDFHWKADQGGCKWFGTAPFCLNHKCPPDHHLARVATHAPATDAYPDAFGGSCYRLFFLFWTKQEKHYCCKGDSNACFINTVTGHWVNGKDGAHVKCTHYSTGEHPCGRLFCSYFRGNGLLEDEAYFREAGRCTNFQIFGYQAVLRCGQISFFDKKANRSHDWFKYY